MGKISKTISIWNGKIDAEWYKSSEHELIIEKAEHFAAFTDMVKTGSNFSGQVIKLNANIVLNDTANWLDWASNPPDNAWTPIGTADSPFHGTFDGNGHIVSGVYVNNSGSDHQGLFGVVNGKATIKNLGVANSYVKGKNYVGGLVGNNDGNVSNCYSISMVTGQNNVGVLIGWNSGKINNCYSVEIVTGNRKQNRRLVGTINENSSVGSSYYEAESSNLSDDSSKGESKTTEQMKMQSTFTNWDFTNTWDISSKINERYPYLRILTP
jgi:hypothetical protein